MAQLAVIDVTWLAVPPDALAEGLAEPARWPSWWPELRIELAERRGAEGLRWAVRSAAGGRLAGEMEFWLLAMPDGVLAHYQLRLDPRPRPDGGAGRPLGRRAESQLVAGCRAGAKRAAWEVGDRLDPGRLARVARLS